MRQNQLEKLQLEMEDESLETGAYNALYDCVDALEEKARDRQKAYSAEDLALASTMQSCFARSRQSDSLMHDFEIEVMPDIRAHRTPNAALFNRFKRRGCSRSLVSNWGLRRRR